MKAFMEKLQTKYRIGAAKVKSYLIKRVRDSRPHYLRLAAFVGTTKVGEAVFTIGDALEPDDVWVEPAYRQRGIATALYVEAESLTGKKIRRVKELESPLAKKLWGQKNRPFG